MINSAQVIEQQKKMFCIQSVSTYIIPNLKQTEKCQHGLRTVGLCPLLCAELRVFFTDTMCIFFRYTLYIAASLLDFHFLTIRNLCGLGSGLAEG